MNVEPRPLAGTDLVEAWLRHEPRAEEFLPGRPERLESYTARVDEVDARFENGARRQAAAYLSGGGTDGPARLDAFVKQRGFLVTTGQQPGLFGGPLMALYKAHTAAALARRLESVTGRPVLPVFWIASEDHDWEEVRGTHVLDVDNEIREIGLSPGAPGAPRPPLHRIRPGAELPRAVDRLFDLQPPTEFAEHWRSLLLEAYSEGASLAEGFADAMAALLEPYGVFFVQAHEPSLKERALPILLQELEDSEDRSNRLGFRAQELQAAGFDVQVPILDGATNLFLEGPAGRERVLRDDDSFVLRSSKTRLSTAELRSRASDDPSSLSPNALLRPVVESALLPTLAYVAGPAEIAYLAQTAPVFRGHGVEQPIVHPRGSFVVIERKVGKVLDKLGLGVEDLARPDHELANHLAREEMPPEVTDVLTRLREAVQEEGDRLRRTAVALDPGLEGAVESYRSRAGEALGDVERKIVQSVKRRNETVLAQADKARRHLFPLGRPQERVLNPFYYLVRYDRSFLDAMAGAAKDAVLP